MDKECNLEISKAETKVSEMHNFFTFILKLLGTFITFKNMTESVSGQLNPTRLKLRFLSKPVI